MVSRIGIVGVLLLTACATVETTASSTGSDTVAGFDLDGVFYPLSCAAVQDELVTDQVIGNASLYGEDVTVNRIVGVDVSVLVAVSVPGGYCSDTDPNEIHTNWSMAFHPYAEQAEVERAICQVGALSPSSRLVNGCHLEENLLTCGSGPGFPEGVLDDLSVFPEPSESFGEDVAAILGTDNQDDLVGWHVIVEEQNDDGSYVQLLIREAPETGDLEYILGGSDETFDEPRPCQPRPLE